MTLCDIPCPFYSILRLFEAKIYSTLLLNAMLGCIARLQALRYNRFIMEFEVHGRTKNDEFVATVRQNLPEDFVSIDLHPGESITIHVNEDNSITYESLNGTSEKNGLQEEDTGPIYNHPGFVFNSELNVLRVMNPEKEEWMRLTPREGQVLELLTKRVGRIVNFNAFKNLLYERENVTKQEVSDLAKTYIKRLRDRIDKEGEESYILNFRKLGYMLVESPTDYLQHAL